MVASRWSLVAGKIFSLQSSVVSKTQDSSTWMRRVSLSAFSLGMTVLLILLFASNSIFAQQQQPIVLKDGKLLTITQFCLFFVKIVKMIADALLDLLVNAEE